MSNEKITKTLSITLFGLLTGALLLFTWFRPLLAAPPVQILGTYVVSGGLTATTSDNANLTATGTIAFPRLGSSGNPCLTIGSTGLVATSTCGSGITFGTATSTAGINVATTTNTLTLSLRNTLADFSGLATTTGSFAVASSTGGWEELVVGSNGQVAVASSSANLGVAWTTFSLNGLSGQWTQTFATSTGINISSSGSTHTFSLRGSLQDISGLAVTDSNFIVGNGTTWVAESGATARTSLGVAIGTNVQAWDDDLDDIAALAPTKGDILTTAGTNWADLAVGSDGAYVRASSTATNGIDWGKDIKSTYFLIESPNSTEDDAVMVFDSTSTLYKIFTVNKRSGDTVTFNLCADPNRSYSSSTCPYKVFAADQTVTATSTPSSTISFGTSTIPTGGVLRFLTGGVASSTQFNITIYYTTP